MTAAGDLQDPRRRSGEGSSAARSGTPCEDLSDEELIERLRSEGELLPRAAVDECLRRRDRLVVPLGRLCRDARAWQERGSRECRAAFHAVLILGAMDDHRTFPALIRAAGHVERSGFLSLRQLLVVILPLAALAKGPPGEPEAEARRRNARRMKEVYRFLRWGLSRMEVEHDRLTDELREIAEGDHPPEIRGLAAAELARGPHRRNRELLDRLAAVMRKRVEPAPPGAVSPAQGTDRGERPPSASFEAPWLEFYDPERVEERRERLRGEERVKEENDRWAAGLEAEAGWVAEEVRGFLGEYERTLQEGPERNEALEAARFMAGFLTSHERLPPWRWDPDRAVACLLHSPSDVLADEAALQRLHGNATGFIRFCAASGRLPERDRAEVERALEEAVRVLRGLGRTHRAPGCAGAPSEGR